MDSTDSACKDSVNEEDFQEFGYCHDQKDAVLPLNSCRVLNLADEKGCFCGKILAELGADVIRIEPPGGDPARKMPPFFHNNPSLEKSLYWLAYNTTQRSIILDIETSKGQGLFSELAKTSDFVIESFPPGYMDRLGLGYSNLSQINPSLVMTSITPFGQDGPYKDWKASDLVLASMGGLLYMTGDPDRAPLQIGGAEHSYLVASAYAAAGTMIAHYYRLLTGQGQYIDASVLESVVLSTLTNHQYQALEGHSPKRAGNYHLIFGKRRTTLWQCKDGYIAWAIFLFSLASVTRALVEWMESEGQAGELKDIKWQELGFEEVDQKDLRRWEDIFAGFLRKHTKAEILKAAEVWHFRAFPVSTPKDLLEDSQLAARNYWTKVEYPEFDTTIIHPGSLYKSSEIEWRIPKRAPLLGEHNKETINEEKSKRTELLRSHPLPSDKELKNRKQALEGIKVADFSWAVTGPLTSLWLAQHGAEVVKIETITNIDRARTSNAFKDGKSGINRAANFANYNTNKYSLSLNLNTTKGIEVAKRLIAWADIVVENFSPGTMAKWGLGYDDTRKINPDIIMLSSSMQGQTGPGAYRAGFGVDLAALAGFSHFVGWPDRGPTALTMAYTDTAAPPIGVVAIMAALATRLKTKRGQYIDLSQLESCIHYLTPALLDYVVNGENGGRKGNSHPWAAPHGAYRCRGDDRWCAISVLTDEEWKAFCWIIGQTVLADDSEFTNASNRKKREEELNKLIEAWTINYTPEEIVNRLQDNGIAAGVVADGKDVLDNPQLKHRDHFVPLNHPEIGQFLAEAPPFRLSKTPRKLYRAAPCLGEHTEYVCTQILGMSDEEFLKLCEERVLE